MEIVALCLAGLVALASPPAARAAVVPAADEHAADQAPAALPVVLPMRERAALRDRWTARRLETVVPALMEREGVDMWVLIAREYNEDPVVETMLPARWLAARRRTVLLFHRTASPDGPVVERLSVSRYAVGRLFPGAWNKEEQPDQWARLAEIVAERDPATIAINVSPTFALADGLSHSEHEALRAALGPELSSRLVSGERLAIGWLETRIDEEMEVYPSLCALAHGIIAEGFSAAAIQPGHTTTEDLEWWYRDRIRALGLVTWFHPSVSAQRAGGLSHTGTFTARPGAPVIRRGDLLHGDFGITYLGLNTDTQQHAYVLRAGETSAPAGLTEALAVGNRLQDILLANMTLGRSGNEILAGALRTAQAEGITGKIYTHPLGFHGHGAGPTIGLWDQQGGVPGRGDYPLFANTAHSIELGVTVPVPDWDDQPVQIMLEEDAFFDGETVRYMDGRQTALLLVR